MKYKREIVKSYYKRRAPQGARGLKYSNRDFKTMPRGRAPQGARGLKFLFSLMK